MFYSLKLHFLPSEAIFFPTGTIVKTFEIVYFVKLRCLQCFMYVVGILGCYRDYSVKIMSKIVFCVDFFSIFIYTIPPGKKIQNFFLENKSFIKV